MQKHAETYKFVVKVHRSRTNVKKYSVHNRFPIFSASGLLVIVLRSNGQISVEVLKNISRSSSEIDEHTISPYNVYRFLSSQVMRLKEIVNSGYYLVPPNSQNFYFKKK